MTDYCRICAGKMSIEEVLNASDKEIDMSLCRTHLKRLAQLLRVKK